jgi:septation ring formation regulator EzrA
MFGNSLSSGTVEELAKLLKMDIDNVMNSNIDTLRYNVEELYDIAEENVMASAMNGDSIRPETERFTHVKGVYSLLMGDIENLLNRTIV